MKKLIALLMLVCLAFAPALAEERVSIPLADGELSFTPFEDGYCLTKDTSASVFGRLGLSQREMFVWMDEQRVDALMYDADFGCEASLCVYESEFQRDYAALTAEERQQLRDGFREFYEQYGHLVHQADVLEMGQFSFLHGFITLTYADGSVENRIVYETVYHGYYILLTLFTMEGVDPADYAPVAEKLAGSIVFTPNAGAELLALDGVSIQLAVPDGITIHASADKAGVTPPEAVAGEVVGCMADPAGKWFILWQLDDRVTGDLDRMSDAAVKSLYQGRARNKKAAGCNVTLTEDHPDSRQRYIRIGYKFSDENGAIWYAEEYYTKQAGWGVSVTLYSDAPLTEDVQTLLETIVNSQMVAVDE